MKSRLKTAAAIFALLWSLASIPGLLSPAFAFTVEEVKPLLRKDYYPAVLDLIRNAERSIYLVMYGIQLRDRDENDLVHNLLRGLIEADRRGARVTVILQTGQDDSWGEYVTRINREVKQLLRSEGIRVYLDDDQTTTHAKLLVVDEEITVLGSHNWTFAAFMRNNESSVLIRSRPLARQYIRYFQSIRR